MAQTPSMLGTIQSYLDELGRSKTATEGVGKTTHPVMSADDGTEAAREGARAAENDTDVKRENPVSVDSTPDAPTGTDAADNQFQIGTHKSEVGGDPAVEDDYEGFPHEPGTSGPVKADEGRKYGSQSFDELYAASVKQANTLCAKIASGRNPAGQPPPAAGGAAKAGYDAAAAASPQAEKAAATAFVENTIHEAGRAAILTRDYLTAYAAKQAEAGGMEADPAAGGLPPGGPPPGGPAPGGPPGGGDIASLLAGGGAGGGAPPMPGGAPPMPGGDPGAGGDAGGGMPPDASHEEILHELASAMTEMGITPEELAAVMSQGGGGGEGPPGGEAPPAGGPPDPAAKAASAKAAKQTVDEVRRYRRSGKFAFAPPAGKRAAAIRGIVREMLGELLAGK